MNKIIHFSVCPNSPKISYKIYLPGKQYTIYLLTSVPGRHKWLCFTESLNVAQGIVSATRTFKAKQNCLAWEEWTYLVSFNIRQRKNWKTKIGILAHTFIKSYIYMTTSQTITYVVHNNFFSSGLMVYLIYNFCIYSCWLGCCLIPFYIQSCKDVLHLCPYCGSAVGRYNRLCWEPRASIT